MEPSKPPPLPVPDYEREVERRSGPRKKKSNTKLVLWLAIGIPVGLVLAVASCALLADFLATDLPVKDVDRDVLLKADHVAEWMEDLTPDASAEVFNKRRYIDGSYELEYEYEHTDDELPLYIACTVVVERKSSDAAATYFGVNVGTEIGGGIADLEFVERDDLFRWGAKSTCNLIKNDAGFLVGNYFACQKGKRVFTLLLVGLYFDESESLREFLKPVLNRVDGYTPSK